MQDEKKIHKNAARTFARKIKLERNVIGKLESLFTSIAKNSNYEKILNLSDKKLKLEKILNDHHIKTAKSFAGDIRKLLGAPDNDKKVQNIIDSKIKGAASARASLMSDSITETISGIYDNISRDAHAESAMRAAPFSKDQLSNNIAEEMRARLKSKIVTVAVTETQVAAESGKHIEIQTLDKTDAIFGDVKFKEMEKQRTWIATLDDHTRDDHAEADSQVVGLDEPFDVGGDAMMFPGDDSLGASADNCINCRCSAELIIS